MLEPPVRGFFRGLEEQRVLTPMCAQRPSEHAPCLRASPGTVVADPFMSVAPQHRTGVRVKTGGLADRTVVAHTKFDVAARVAHCDFPQTGVTALARSPRHERCCLHHVHFGLARTNIGGLLKSSA